MSFIIRSGANLGSAVYNATAWALTSVAGRAVTIYPEVSHGWGTTAARVGIVAVGMGTAAAGLQQMGELSYSTVSEEDKDSNVVRRAMKIARIGLILGVSAAELTIAYCLPSVIRRFIGE